jgi:hypothetical protein
MNDKFRVLFDSFKNDRDREFIEEAIRIQNEAQNEGIRLRLLGALAFRYQCPQNAAHFEALERRITDIDFAASTDQRDRLLDFFKKQGYLVDESVLVVGGGYRYIFDNPRKQKHIDIFFDRLEMCHTVPFGNRLDIDEHTISLSDLLLEKMQIVEISRKDSKDTAVLLLEHGVGQDDTMINMAYVGKIMRDDWGFYQTFTTNLSKLKDAVAEFENFDDGERAIICQRIDEIIENVNGLEKSLRWKARAKIGTRLKWYREVD